MEEETRMIRVRVKQAHKTITPGGFKEMPVGKTLKIPESEFCENLHERIDKEEKEDGTRIKKRRSTGAEPF